MFVRLSVCAVFDCHFIYFIHALLYNTNNPVLGLLLILGEAVVLWWCRRHDRQAGLTFEFLYVKTHCWDNVSILKLLGLEMIEECTLATVIQAHHQHVALLLPQAQHGAQSI